MKFHRDLRQELIKEFRTRYEVGNELRKNPDLAQVFKDKAGDAREVGKVLDDIAIENIELQNALGLLEEAKVIVFALEQAEVFLGLTQKIAIRGEGEDNQRAIALDFRVPFARVFLQFTEPLPIQVWGTEDSLLGIGLWQFELDAEKATYANWEAIRVGKRAYAQAGDLFNEILMVFGDRNIRCLAWTSRRDLYLDAQPDLDGDILQGWDRIRDLAIACIGYINCVNVELVKEGEVPEKVNRKREKDGKKRLEPYYLCKIKTDVKRKEHATSQAGIHHSFRYDVRGHFRRLATGRTIWVMPHQRGLEHLLYVPKIYGVEGQGNQ